jgi:hypothetical protein
MRNKILRQIKEKREIVFNDIIYVINKACEEKARKAIEDSTFTIESITEQLKKCGCTDIQLFQVYGDERYITGQCIVNFTANELEGLIVPFSRQVSIDVECGEIEKPFFGSGAIAMAMKPDEMHDIDLVHQIFLACPDYFNPNDFCE